MRLKCKKQGATECVVCCRVSQLRPDGGASQSDGRPPLQQGCKRPGVTGSPTEMRRGGDSSEGGGSISGSGTSALATAEHPLQPQQPAESLSGLDLNGGSWTRPPLEAGLAGWRAGMADIGRGRWGMEGCRRWWAALGASAWFAERGWAAHPHPRRGGRLLSPWAWPASAGTAPAAWRLRGARDWPDTSHCDETMSEPGDWWGRSRRPHSYTPPTHVHSWGRSRRPRTYTLACSGQGIAASHARAFRFVSIFCRSALYTSVYSTPGRHRVGSRSCAWGCALHAAPHPTPLFTLRSALRTSLYSAHCRLLPLFTPPCAPLRTLRLPLLPSALHPLRALRLPLLPSALQSSLDSTPPFTRHSHLPYTHLHSFTLH